MPNCDSFTININGALAQREREMISTRMKDGLAVEKAKGVKLGTKNLNMEMVRKRALREFRHGNSVLMILRKSNYRYRCYACKRKELRQVAAELERFEVKTAREGEAATAVKNAVKRLKL